MAANKYVALVAGKLKEVIATVISAGAGDANKIVALDSTGHLDISVMPVGVAAEVVTAITSENITAGALVNLYSNAGVLTIRNADATTNTKPAHGFVIASTTSPASATMYIFGQTNNFVTGLTIGTKYVLSKTTPGGVTDIATFAGAQASGNIVQEIGTALSATSVTTNQNQNYIEVA